MGPIYKKTLTVEKMLRTSLVARKPKAELRRLHALWKECATDTLQKITDDNDVMGQVSLEWAEGMKNADTDFTHLIESLGR